MNAKKPRQISAGDLVETELFTLRARGLIAKKLSTTNNVLLVCDTGFLDQTEGVPVSDVTALCIFRKAGFDIAEVFTAEKADKPTDADKLNTVMRLMDDMARAVRVSTNDASMADIMQPFLNASERVYNATMKRQYKHALRTLLKDTLAYKPPINIRAYGWSVPRKAGK